MHAVDMPLTVSPSEIVSCLAEKVKQVDEGEGVLMLVDMGSLAMLKRLQPMGRVSKSSDLTTLIYT